jgi:hypothetical protein
VRRQRVERQPDARHGLARVIVQLARDPAHVLLAPLVEPAERFVRLARAAVRHLERRQRFDQEALDRRRFVRQRRRQGGDDAPQQLFHLEQSETLAERGAAELVRLEQDRLLVRREPAQEGERPAAFERGERHVRLPR